MRKGIIIFSVLMFFFNAARLVYGFIPDLERAALIALFEASDGDNWKNNSGWKEEPLEADGFALVGSENTWYGVIVSDNHVNKILLTKNNLSGILPSELGNFKNLEWIDLNRNHLTGSIPSELGNLKNLEGLILIGNQISGSIPVELSNLSKLRILNLCCNQLSGAIPPELGNLKSLKTLDLYGNQLSGTIPPELENLTNLEWLVLSSNLLNGNIPLELSNLKNLSNLSLGHNKLSGSIPSDLAKLINLKWLDLSLNRLSGDIPSDLVNLRSLRHLNLCCNRLIGSLPDNLDNFSAFHIEIGYNGLYSNDDRIRDFLNRIDLHWKDTQTIAPTNIHATPISTTSILVSWTPIIYNWDSGGYMVYYSKSSEGPWTKAGITTDKTSNSCMVTGLKRGTKYYFVIQTRTNPNKKNSNTVVSEYSKEVSTKTKSF